MLAPAKRTLPKVGPRVTGLVCYPRTVLTRPIDNKFRFESAAEQAVAMALDLCPQGTLVAFRVRDRETVTAKTGFTRSNPFYLNGEVYVEICGQYRAFRFDSIQIVERLMVDEGDEDGD